MTREGTGAPAGGGGPPTPRLSWPRRALHALATLWRPDQLRAWAAPYRRRGGVRAALVRHLEALLLALHQAFRQDIFTQAAALTYNTLLAIVPLLAVAFASFQAFGGLQRFREPLNRFILNNVAAGSAAQVGHWMDRFIGRINAGAIAGVSVIFLFWSAIGLLTTVEGALNRIWGVQRGRPMMTRVMMYWSIVTLTPPLLAISLSVTARLESASFTTTVLGVLPFGLGRLVLNVGSAVTISLAFILIYLIVPNTKVQLVPALIGGLVAGLVWSLLKALFVTVVSGSLSYSLVYGALGILPFFMLWLWVSWIVLRGDVAGAGAAGRGGLKGDYGAANATWLLIASNTSLASSCTLLSWLYQALPPTLDWLAA